MNKIEKIIDRVRALRARAENEASSPEEVATAAARAAKLIMENDLTELDLQDAGCDVSYDTYQSGRRVRHPALRMAAYGIGEISECTTYWRAGSLLIAGFEADRALAAYLVQLVLAASERGWRLARTKYGLISTKERKSYLLAFGQAVELNLVMLARERKANREQHAGTALVLVKSPMIAEHMTTEFGEIGQGRKYTPRSISQRAAYLGDRDGGDLNVNRPIEKEMQAAQIT